MRLKIVVENRDGTSWKIHDDDTLDPVDLTDEITPNKDSLFNGDVFDYDQETKCLAIVHSIIRSVPHIPGILVMVGNKSYGKHPTNSKTYYKCVPDDKRIPAFLIPYEYKQSVFSKLPHNLYVTFSFLSWDKKHPVGKLIQNLGAVNETANYYEYILYCKSLNASIKVFNKSAQEALRINKNINDVIENIMNKNPKIESRINHQNIITIDPNGATDFDDAFGVRVCNDYFVLSVYVSNVSVWLEELGLWESFSDRVSTIYLPDRKRPMLPTILSDSLCSLQKHEWRFATAMDISCTWDKILDISFTNTLINVSNNYHYDDKLLHKNDCYNKVFEITKRLSKSDHVIQKGAPNIKGPKDVVAYLMMLMNYECALNMSSQKENGIYRATIIKNNVQIPNVLPDDVYSFLHNWNNYSGLYVHKVSSAHELLELGSYIHITSPIRRLVDLLNTIAFQKNNNMIKVSEQAEKFYNKWTTVEKMDMINTSMRAIRKVQCDCELLRECVNDPKIVDYTFSGVLFDRVDRTDGLYQYMVYIPELKLTSRMTHRTCAENYSSGMFRVFIFNDEENMRRKIRVNMIV